MSEKRKYFVLVAVMALALTFLLAPGDSFAATTDLIISEYGEGSGFNKYIEIYNGSGTAVDLSAYEVWRVSNGGVWPEAQIALSGTLNDGQVLVVYNPGDAATPVDPIIANAGDLQIASGQLSHNGDDAVGLAKSGVLIDAVGEDGADPGTGWDVAGVTNATVDHVLVRKDTVCTPNTDWTASRGTDTTDSEWIVLANEDWSDIGVHTANCGDVEPGTPEVLLSEIVVTPTDGEFVEIYNPTGSAIDLSDFYLTDATFAGGSTYYYNIVTGSNAGGGGFGDFLARFPDGASIAAGEYQTIAMSGSAGFITEYGFAPTYELFDDLSNDGEQIMREALPGSINGQGGLTNDGEVVVLFYWDGASDLVVDMDYAVWGDKAEAVDKTGVSIDGPDADTDLTAYQDETAIADQDVVAPGSPAFGTSWQRDDMTEGAEVSTGGNGVNGEDETSEDLSNTWCENPPTPGEANDCTPPPPPPGSWIINEINADPDAVAGDANGDGIVNTTDDEFVEIYNNSGGDVDISGWTLADGFGVRHTFAANTVVPDGCAVVVFAGGTPTGAFGGSLVQTASSGALGLNNTGDTVALSDGVNNLATQGFGSEGGDNQSLTLDPDVTGTPPLVKHSTVVLANGALFSPGTLVDGSAFSGCPTATEYKIHEIQGDGAASPLVGEEVIIEGIVVGDFQDFGQFGGFHVQEEDADVDGNPATSEGIFVYHYSTAVAPGEVVRVTGTVAEYNGLTELTSVSDVQILSSGASVTAASLALPITAVEELEAYEGMLVTFPQGLYITEFFNFDRYGEIVLSAERQFQPTAVYEPGSVAAADLAAANQLGRITLDDGRSNQNPDPARHPNGLEFTLSNTFRGGDIVQNLTGVMDYAFGSYKIQPTTGADYIPQNPRTEFPDDVAGTLKVASFNVLNYFSTIDTGAWICGPTEDMECRGADTPEEFERQRDKIFAALTAIDADVVGLIEIENHVTDAAVQDLVTGLNEALGVETYGYIATGPIGTDAIKQAFIYKLATVTPVGSYAVLDDLSFVDPLSSGEWKNRPALAQTFEQNATGGEVTVVVNHLKSKGSACGAGDDDPEQGNCNLTRTLAAQVLVDWLATDPTGSGDADYLIIGDMNAYDKEDPIDVVLAGADDSLGTGDDYTDLAYQLLGEFAYSYVFDGQLGYLDYALANQDLFSQVTGVTIWNINSDEPDIIDYDMTFKQDAQDALYEPNAYRSSDHDPVIVGLLLEGDDLYLSSNSDGSAGDVFYADEDIILYDMGTGQWSMYFDGSDVGVKGTDVDALHVMEDGSLLLSFEQKINIPGFGKVQPADIVKFIPTSTGADTAGSFELFFQGAPHGLNKFGENVDAIAFTPDGRLVVSTLAAFSVTLPGGDRLRGVDDDLIVLDDNGNFEMYLEGSDVWDHTEDVWGTWIDAATGDIYLSMQNEFTAGSVSGDDLDVFICHPDSLGDDSACTFSMYFDGSETSYTGNSIDGFAIVK